MRQIKALLSFSSVVISFCCQRRWCPDRSGHKLITANIQCPKALIWEFPATGLAVSSTNRACFTTLCSDPALRHLLIASASSGEEQGTVYGGKKCF